MARYWSDIPRKKYTTPTWFERREGKFPRQIFRSLPTITRLLVTRSIPHHPILSTSCADVLDNSDQFIHKSWKSNCNYIWNWRRSEFIHAIYRAENERWLSFIIVKILLREVERKAKSFPSSCCCKYDVVGFLRHRGWTSKLEKSANNPSSKPQFHRLDESKIQLVLVPLRLIQMLHWERSQEIQALDKMN